MIAAWYDANGQLLQGPLVVNETPTGETTTIWYTQAAATADGSVLITWRQWNADTVLARLFDSQGNAISGEVRLNPEPSRYYGDVAVAATDPAQFVVIWNELDETLPYDRHLLVGRTVSTDGALGDIFSVSRVEEADQIRPSVVSTESGRFLITWFNEVGQQTIQARLLGDTPSHPAFDIAGAREEVRPRVCVLTSGDIVFAWEGYRSAFEQPSIVNDGAWFRSYSPLGDPLGDPLPILPADTRQRVTGFVCPADGASMVVIDVRNVIIGRALQSSAVTTEFEIVRNYGGAADVTSLSTNDFVVTWTDCFDPYENEEPDCELRAQVYSRGELPCSGDCNLNGEVTIDELVLSTGIALGSDNASMRMCLPADRDLDYRVDIADLIGAVTTSLGGCQ